MLFGRFVITLMPLAARALSVRPIATRRLALQATSGTLFAAAFSPVAALAAKPVSDGKWAQRYEPFTDADFEGMKTTPSGLQYTVVEEGYGVKPLAGQKIKAHYAGCV